MENIFDGLITDKKYMKLKEGENKFRIAMTPISGWMQWKDKKPYRYKKDKKPAISFDDKEPLRPFLACYVWDYSINDLFILELTQTTILKALKSLLESEDWGDLTGYDIKIKRSGTGNMTKYLVEPNPPKPMLPAIKSALIAHPVRLEALFDGTDPWNKQLADALECANAILDDSDVILSPSIDSKPNKEPSMANDGITPYLKLKSHLEADGIATERLEEWIKMRCQTIGQSPEEVIAMLLDPNILPGFKKSFVK